MSKYIHTMPISAKQKVYHEHDHRNSTICKGIDIMILSIIIPST